MERNSLDAQQTRKRVRKPRKDKLDYTLFIVIFVLVVIGLIMVYSTSYYTANLNYKDPAYWLKRQGIFAFLGMLAMLFVSKIDYHYWKKIIMPALVVVDALLILVLVIGKEVNGAKRWIQIGPLPAFQPSEIAKLVLIVAFAGLLSRQGKQIRKIKNLAAACVWVVPTAIFVGVENMSTALILLSIIVIMIFVDYPRIMPLIAAGALVVVIAVIMLVSESYRMERITAWLDPENAENGYQTMQSLYAIGSGGVTGKGLGQSLQKLGFIPEAHNDMIFSIICEELGFVGGVSVIVLFVILIFRMVKIAINAYDLFGSLIAVGSIAHIGMQVLINVAVVTNTIPNTGVPLPFISYGGTSMIFLLAELGIVMNVARSVYWEK